MFKEFKEFVMRGNVVDMAVGIVIGAAFGGIVKSFVDDVLMPPIGLLLGHVDFANLFIVLKEGAKAAGPYASLAAAKAAGAVTLNWGTFINTIISFIIIAFAVFLVIKGINRLKWEQEAPGCPSRLQGVRLLLFNHSHPGQPLPSLHLAVAAGLKGRTVLTKIRLGISACLLGEKVRFDGGHKWDHFLTGTLGQFVEFVPVCPEVECGLGIPREAMRLEAGPEGPRLVTIRTRVDYTEPMRAWAQKRLVALEREDLCGFIFKSGSPSSGMERVKIYVGRGGPARTGVGMFAREFRQHFPLLPVADEGRLHDPSLQGKLPGTSFYLEALAGNVIFGFPAGTSGRFSYPPPTAHQVPQS